MYYYCWWICRSCPTAPLLPVLSVPVGGCSGGGVVGDYGRDAGCHGGAVGV
jgi:hypothetical protein